MRNVTFTVDWSLRDSVKYRIGDYFFRKYRDRAAKVGYYKAALQMRKQGIPLEVTRAILLCRTF